MKIGQILIFLCALAAADRALPWGDEGHKVVALIARAYMAPAAQQRVDALLAGDPTDLVPNTDMVDEATWADYYRDSDRPRGPRYLQTRTWHFVDIELRQPDIDAACNGHPRVPRGIAASRADPDDCVVDKIGEFAGELADPATPAPERRMALQFLLHFVGDLHQPLHAADDHDRGGNGKRVTTDGGDTASLHGYWDAFFVAALGSDENAIAQRLIAHISPAQRAQWSSGSTRDWAFESFQLARSDAYGRLPPPLTDGTYRLDPSYVANAQQVVGLQLSRAGVRLAAMLNRALGDGSLADTPEHSKLPR